MQRFINVDLKLLSEIKRYQLAETMIRIDISMICKVIMLKLTINTEITYDLKKLASYIIYLGTKYLY